MWPESPNNNMDGNDTDTPSEEERLLDNVDDTDDNESPEPAAARTLSREAPGHEERTTERILTGTEFTTLYNKNIAKHRTGGGQPGPVSFDGHKLFHVVGGGHVRPKKVGPRSSARALYSQPHPRVYSTTTPRASKRSISAGRPAGRKQQPQQQHSVATAPDEPSAFNSFLSQGDALRKRTIPGKDMLEPEALYMELMRSKQRNIQLENENQGHKTKLRKLQKENLALEHRVDELFRSSAVVGDSINGTKAEAKHVETNLVRNLRSKIRMLETNLSLVMEEYNKLKLDGKYLRVRELETEVKAYYSETRRLQRILDQVTHSRNKDSEKQALDEALALLQDREQTILRLRDEAATLKRAAKQQKLEIDGLHDDHDRARNDAQMQLGSMVRELDEAHSLANLRQIENQQLQEQLQTACQQAEDYVAEMQRMDTSLRKLRNDFDSLTKENSVLSNEHEADTLTKAQLTSELHTCKQEMNEAIEKAKELELKLADSQREVQSKENEVEMLKDQFNRIKADTDFVMSEKTNLEKEHHKRLLDIADLKEEIDDLKNTLADEQVSHNSAKEKLRTSAQQHQEVVRKIKDDHSAEMESSHLNASAAVEQHQRAYAESHNKKLAEKEHKLLGSIREWEERQRQWDVEKKEILQTVDEKQQIVHNVNRVNERLENMMNEMENKHKADVEGLQRELTLARTQAKMHAPPSTPPMKNSSGGSAPPTTPPPLPVNKDGSGPQQKPPSLPPNKDGSGLGQKPPSLPPNKDGPPPKATPPSLPPNKASGGGAGGPKAGPPLLPPNKDASASPATPPPLPTNKDSSRRPSIKSRAPPLPDSTHTTDVETDSSSPPPASMPDTRPSVRDPRGEGMSTDEDISDLKSSGTKKNSSDDPDTQALLDAISSDVDLDSAISTTPPSKPPKPQLQVAKQIEYSSSYSEVESQGEESGGARKQSGRYSRNYHSTSSRQSEISEGTPKYSDDSFNSLP